MRKEIEAKFLDIDKVLLRERLREAGFTLMIPEYVMRRKTFDFSNVFPGKNRWGRVRQERDKATMSVKEVRGSGIEDTYEVEIVVDRFDGAVSLFEACGFPVKSSQENLREKWQREGVEATIDTWPGLEPFIEIEANEIDIVQRVSAELGFDFRAAIFGSIDLVYEKKLGIPAEEIIRLPEILFENPPKKNAAG